MNLIPLLLALFSAPAWGAAASSSPVAGCVSSLDLALRTGRTDELRGRLTADAVWEDKWGARGGTGAFVAGLRALSQADLELPEQGLRWMRLSTFTWLGTGAAASQKLLAPHRHFVVDLSTRTDEAGKCGSVRLYRGARPWPPAPSHDLPPYTPKKLELTISGFNGRFGKGDVDGWLALWEPGAEFVSMLGSFRGGEVRTFFEQQAKRYREPRMAPARDFTGPEIGGALMEGVLSGTCRSSGRPFRMPYLMLLRYGKEGVRYVYEAFTVANDGCGPFWTHPR
ncbi:MAG: nuclear transport factor 2 family protein [Elusimicrobiota bacterium]